MRIELKNNFGVNEPELSTATNSRFQCASVPEIVSIHHNPAAAAVQLLMTL